MNERFHLCIFDFKKKKTLILLSGQKKHHTRVLCAANKNLTQISMNLHVVQLKKKRMCGICSQHLSNPNQKQQNHGHHSPRYRHCRHP